MTTQFLGDPGACPLPPGNFLKFGSLKRHFLHLRALLSKIYRFEIPFLTVYLFRTFRFGGWGGGGGEGHGRIPRPLNTPLNINIATFVGFRIAVYAYVMLHTFTYTSPSSPSYYLTSCLSNSHFDYKLSHTVVDIQFPCLQICCYRSPRWLYMVMLFLLQLTQLSPQLSTKISTIKNFQISYIYNENCTTFATFNLVTSPTLVPSE